MRFRLHGREGSLDDVLLFECLIGMVTCNLQQTSRVHTQFLSPLHALFMVQLVTLLFILDEFCLGLSLHMGCHRLAEAFKFFLFNTLILGPRFCRCCLVASSIKLLQDSHHPNTYMINYAHDSVGVLDIFVACKIADGS